MEVYAGRIGQACSVQGIFIRIIVDMCWIDVTDILDKNEISVNAEV